MSMALSAWAAPKEECDTVANGQQDDVVISLITCYPGADVYELYGHTMLRVQYGDIDMVYNYGIFDFDAPNFIYRFVKGETDYKVAGYDGAYMLVGYRSRKVVEQQLNLTRRQAMQVLLALVENARPENATYRYNYVYDNCATRPRDIIEGVLGDKLHYGEMHDTLTFRQEMRRYNANYAWQQFGIDLVLGSGIDYTLNYREQMFVPMVLMQAFAEAAVVPPNKTNEAQPEVTKTAPIVFLFMPSAASAGPIKAKHKTPKPVAEVITIETALPSRKATKTRKYGCFTKDKGLMAMFTKASLAPMCVM